MRVLITAALPYANGELHLGHLRSTYLPADVFKRFLKLIGNEAIYVCGTDEHGTPILIKAEQVGMKPEEYIKIWRKRHAEDFKAMEIEFDIFYNTHNEIHFNLVWDFYEKLKPWIYEAPVLQYWCTKENRPLPDRYVIGTCPFCGAKNQYGDTCEVCGRAIPPGKLINPRCKICGAPAEVRQSRHLFFKLSEFSEKLREFAEKLETTEDVRRFVLSWIREGLKDWDIEREISWGVPIPGRKSVFYVWFDAPIGYITDLLKYCEERGEEKKDCYEKWWEKSDMLVHFIGKDIIYHHALFWPAMLMGAKRRLPTHLAVRGYLTLEGKKFSKSRRWYISIRDWVENKLDVEYLRFYLIYTTPSGTKDSDFSPEEFRKVINHELIDNYGNLLHRVVKLSKGKVDGELEEPWEKALELAEEWKKLMLDIKLMEALRKVVDFTHELNSYFQKNEPWKRQERKADVLFTTASALKLVTIMLSPVIPKYAEEASKVLNISLDWDLKPLERPHEFGEPKIIFRKVSEEDVKVIKGIYAKG